MNFTSPTRIKIAILCIKPISETPWREKKNAKNQFQRRKIERKRGVDELETWLP